MPTLKYRPNKTKVFRLKRQNVVVEVELNRIIFLQNKEYRFDFHVSVGKHKHNQAFQGFYLDHDFKPEGFWIKINNAEPFDQVSITVFYLFKLRYKVAEFFEQQVNKATNIIAKGGLI